MTRLNLTPYPTPEDVTPESAYTRDPFGIVGGPKFAVARPDDAALLRFLAHDLYEMHLRTGISLDDWPAGRDFVEKFYGPILKNGA